MFQGNRNRCNNAWNAQYMRGNQNGGSQRGSQRSSRSGTNYSAPNYTADVHDAFIQSTRGSYFIGLGDEIITTGNAYFLLCNPCNSDVNLCINKASLTNLGSTAVSLSEYICAYSYGDFYNSGRVSNANTNYCGTCPNGVILSSDCVTVSCGNPIDTSIVPALTTETDTPRGSIIISPGNSYILQVSNINDSATSLSAVASFSWWEEACSTNGSGSGSGHGSGKNGSGRR